MINMMEFVPLITMGFLIGFTLTMAIGLTSWIISTIYRLFVSIITNRK